MGFFATLRRLWYDLPDDPPAPATPPAAPPTPAAEHPPGQPEEVPPEEVPPEEAPPEEAPPEEVPPEEAQPEEVPPEEAQPEEVPPEEVPPEEVPAEEAQPEEVPPEEVPPEEAPPEEVPPEEVPPEEVQPEEVPPEEVPPEEVQPEEVQPEEVQPEEVQPEEVQPEEVPPEEAQPEEAPPPAPPLLALSQVLDAATLEAAHPLPVPPSVAKGLAGQPHGISHTDPPELVSDVELAFSAHLLGFSGLRRELSSPEQRALIDQIDLLATPGHDAELPRLPKVVPQLLGLVRRPDTGALEISALIAQDPSLVGEVLHLANSPAYRGELELTRLDDAVMRLGQKGMQRLVMQVAMRPIYSQRSGRFSRQAGTILWRLSELCAHTCSHLVMSNKVHDELGADAFAGYLAGLLVVLGEMASLRILDHSPEHLRLDGLGFHHALIEANARLSARLAEVWELPASVTQSLQLRQQTLPAHAYSPSGTQLGAALRAAQRASMMHLLQVGPQALGQRGDWATALQVHCLKELQRVF
jgi:HD-like signal output (HDOD) protein